MRSSRPPALQLFSYDWDRAAFDACAGRVRFDHAGFDLFSFPSQVGLLGFDLDRFTDRLVRRAARRGWQAVVSHHEQFGALAAALLAERLGLPGASPDAILACQHKLHARRVLERVAPEATVPCEPLPVGYGETIPEGLRYPCFAKPVKAAFSVLAREVDDRAALQALTRFGWAELWIIRRLVEPFERIARQRLPEAGTAHRMMLEQPVQAPQYNLDGVVVDGEVHALGVVDAIMYPGTQAFMRWDLPSRLDPAVQARALDVARRFLGAVGFTRGCFNMEFFHDPVSDRLTVIEFNPRLASQFGDLYRRVLGLDPHSLSLTLALGGGLADEPRREPTAGATSSFVFRAFHAGQVPPMPSRAQRAAFAARFPDGMLLPMPKQGAGLAREFKWLGSHRYGVMHLGGRDEAELRRHCEEACTLLGWPLPYAEAWTVDALGQPQLRLRPDSRWPAGQPVLRA
ncbi:ATP-grasp domain-containing protein [Aquariibacter albus]|uniref:ATP-grasp domain-containing protein n=1 Tax=Aquariibacter albus TaxID=2759899 RepID=A0A839HIS5_9BURK|nr:ATP-grasp domain-containing protein [Aquariibacter albus]MBB1160752.1 ATP-grasp domain-containing protein [Aquariibacter albus]